MPLLLWTSFPPWLPLRTQLSGMVCFIVGFVYVWLYLPGVGKGDPTGGKVGKAHLYLGTIVMGLAGMQVGGGGIYIWISVVMHVVRCVPPPYISVFISRRLHFRAIGRRCLPHSRVVHTYPRVFHTS